jgi:hypothetical protein
VKRPRTKLALKLAACALAGALLTVAVAWGCVACASHKRLLPDVSMGWLGFDRTFDQWPDPPPAGWPGRGLTFASEGPGVRGQVWQNAQVWGINDSFYDAYWMRHIECGWPLTALKGLSKHHILRDSGVVDRVRHEHWSGLRLRIRPRQPIMLPVEPHWPGFALDTAFYGALVFLLWSAPGVVRRRTRKRRDRCPTCGYDLRGTTNGPCPECGA